MGLRADWEAEWHDAAGSSVGALGNWMPSTEVRGKWDCCVGTALVLGFVEHPGGEVR